MVYPFLGTGAGVTLTTSTSRYLKKMDTLAQRRTLKIQTEMATSPPVVAITQSGLETSLRDSSCGYVEIVVT